jgi:hypothetical protein
MKANVLPVTTAEPLQVPSWVPEPVAEVAREAYAAGDESARKTISRLACDERMRHVWHELSRRHRDGTFIHPPGLRSTANANERQAHFMRMVLRDAVRPGRTASRRQAERDRSRMLEMARQLRSDAMMVRDPEIVRRLMAAAETYEQFAKNITSNMQSGRSWPIPMVLDRARGDPAERWLVCAVASQCQLTFLSPLYGVTAIIVSVILGREITPRAVRQRCAYSADKTKKISA